MTLTLDKRDIFSQGRSVDEILFVHCFFSCSKKSQVIVWGSNCEPKFDLFSIIRMHESWDGLFPRERAISQVIFIYLFMFWSAVVSLSSILEGCGYSEAFCIKSSSLVETVVTTSKQTLETFQRGSMQPLFAIGWKLVCDPKTHTCLLFF